MPQTGVTTDGSNTVKVKSVNLKDSEGDDIVSSGKWYKIMLADGSELGMTTKTLGKQNCGPKPSGQGAIFRFRHAHGVEGMYGWQAGQRGYLKAQAGGSDGRVYRMHLSLSMGAPPDLSLYNTDDSYGFVAYQAPGNRILLYALDSESKILGLRVFSSSQVAAPSGLEIKGQAGNFPMALDCSFVPTGPFDDDWLF